MADVICWYRVFRSLDGDQQTLDLKRQLQVVEQEAVILQSKLQSLETENEKLMAENKKLSLLSTNRNIKKSNTDLSNDVNGDKTSAKQKELEASLAAANEKIIEITNAEKKRQEEVDQIRKQLTEVETKNKELVDKLLRLECPSEEIKKTRTPKKVSELATKLALKNMVLDLEKEIGKKILKYYLEHIWIPICLGDILINMKKVEDAKQKAELELKQLKTADKLAKEAEDKVKEEQTKELTEMKKQIKSFDKMANDQKALLTKEKTKADELNTKLTTANNTIKNLEKDKSEIQNKLKKIENDHKTLGE